MRWDEARTPGLLHTGGEGEGEGLDTLMHVGGLQAPVMGLQSTGSMQREPVQQSWAVTLHVACVAGAEA